MKTTLQALRNRIGRDGVLLIVLSTFIWALMESLAGLMVTQGNSHDLLFQTVWVRYGTHLVFMTLVFIPRQSQRLLQTTRFRLQLLRPLTMIGMPLCFILGTGKLSATNVFTVFWLIPILTLGLAAILLRERVPGHYWMTVLVSFIGILFIFHPNRQILSGYALLPLISALCFSLYLVMTRMLQEEWTPTSLFYSALVVFVPWSFALPSFWQPLGWLNLLIMATIGLLGYVTLYCLDKACESTSISKLAFFLYTQPIFQIALHALLFHSYPGAGALLGCLVLLITGTYFLILDNRRIPGPSL
ncbi:hypothetical protein BST81_00810 [Leptolyngbya sp. 'hensonii']|nr:hypothetical protein BST81_00810 [Leptolyngbya sp. 'hensonii']